MVTLSEQHRGGEPRDWFRRRNRRDPLRCCRRASGNGRVLPEPVAFSTGWIVYHEAMRDTARVRAAIDVLIDYFEAHVALFTGRREENG